MKRLSISLVFVGLVFGLVFGSVVGYADTQANTSATFTLDSVLNIIAEGTPELNLTQDDIAAADDGPTEFDGNITVTIQSLSEYNLYTAYHADNISDLTNSEDDFLLLDDGSSNTKAIQYNNNISFDNEYQGSDGTNTTHLVKLATPTGPWGNLTGAVSISGQQQSMGLYLDLLELNNSDRDEGQSWTFDIAFFVEEA